MCGAALLAASLTFAPETWFHIIGGNASKEGIAADIAAIAEAGIGGIQLFHGHADGQLWPGVTNAIPCMSEQWLELVKFAETECHRRGLTFKMQNCPGWSMSGGPWITPDKAMRKLVAFEPDRRPKFSDDDDYHEIGVVTFPAPDGSRDGELLRVFPNPQQLDHGWAYEPKTNLWGRACPPGAWQDSATMTFAKYGASRLDMWEAKAGWGLRRFEMSTNTAPVRSKRDTTLVFGHVNAGRRNHPAPPEATGWECDKMDPRGFEANWNGYLGKLLAAGVKLDGTLVDSWECGTQTWTWKMEEEFAKRNGYALRPWLPALFGYVLKSEAETEKFLLDWRNTCSRLIEENYYGAIASLAHANGMTAQYETAFGDVIVGDILRYWQYADEPMCEFWSPHDNKRGFVYSHDFKSVLPCVSAAHLYGKRRVSAESLTSFKLTFDENFRVWKHDIDLHLARGVTHIVFHTYTHNPVVGGKPPSSSFGGKIGTPFLREQTWWPYLKEFTRYLAFCGRELERGHAAVDILMYLGDDVNHKPSESTLLFGNRYKYDYCNQHALLTRLSVRDGRLALPDGMQYRVLWIPAGTFLAADTETRLRELAAAGARIVRGEFKPDWPSPLSAIGIDGEDVQWYARVDHEETVYFVVYADGQSRFAYLRHGDGTVRWVDPVTGARMDGPGGRLRRRVLHTVEMHPAANWPVWAVNRVYEGVLRLERSLSAGDSCRLNLGEVRDWATVSIDGEEVGRLWCAPYACELPQLAAGEHRVRVETVSTWYNQLVHDASLQEAERKTWTLCGPPENAPFHPSGLFGPVTIEQ